MSDLTTLLTPQQHLIFDGIRTTAETQKTPGYLVGGAVRDWLLGLNAIDDLDFVVEGDAIAFAEYLQAQRGGHVQAYPKFGTATWKLGDVSVDVAMARRETYAHPAALPDVSPCDIETDLQRRDFTINAIAMRLSDFALLDPLDGQADLRAGLMRILHERSFVDDPTRILRGARYAAQFGFALAPNTEADLADGLQYFRSLSGERVKYDLELIFEGTGPEKALNLLAEWSVFRAAGIPAPGSERLNERFSQARERLAGDEWNLDSLDLDRHDLLRAIGWGALTYNVGQLAVSRWVDWIPFEHYMRDALISLGPLSTLSASMLRTQRSRQSDLLHEFSGLALFLGYLFERDALKRKAMLCEWRDWRWVKPVTTGDDLRALGVPPGPIYARILQRLRKARLDDEVKSYAEEQTLLKTLIANEGSW